jgi:hypothetical protein
MKRFFLYALVLFTTATVFYACNKEYSTEGGVTGSSTGFVVKDSITNNCTNVTPNGIYTVGTALVADSNTVSVTVNVTNAGAYVIYSDTINGYYFRTSGFFTSTGVQTVKMKGYGTPIAYTAGGIDYFSVSYGTSFCDFAIPLVASTGGGGGGTGTAVYTLTGAPGGCTSASVAGTYTAGTAITGTANTVTIQVNVTTIGTYTITATGGGMTFSKSSTFTATGAQPVTLTATGTPTTAGANTIPITAGGTTCSFTVTVTGTSVVNNFYPITQNSWWSYDDTDPSFLGVIDSLKRTSTTLTNISGTNYRMIIDTVNQTTYDTSYYRKNGSDYYEYMDADKYATLPFDATQKVELNFLREGVAAGTSYQSPLYAGTTGGIASKIQYTMTTNSVGGTLLVNTVTYNNVMKVTIKSQIALGPTALTDNATFECWYANNVGLIQLSATFFGSAASNFTWKIKNYKVY